MVDEKTKENVLSGGTWLRLLYMILFSIISYITITVIGIVVVVQFIHKLFTGVPHVRLKEFGAGLGRYVARIVHYLTFHSDELPFPFGDWPQANPAPRQRQRKRAAKTYGKRESAGTANTRPTLPPPSSSDKT